MSNKRRELIGTVVSDKRDKTITVSIQRYVKHPIYKKRVKSTKRFHVHDEKNVAKNGDKVLISETRPLSLQKRFRLIKIIEKAIIL